MKGNKLTDKQIKEYIDSVSLPKDKYKNYYFVYIQTLSDGKLSIVFTKGSPLNLWEFIYRKYYGFSGNVLLSTLEDFGESDILTYYAANDIKLNDDYTHENFIHLHLIRLSTLKKNNIYFYFRKSQIDDVVDVLSKLLNIPKSDIENIISVIVKKSKNKPVEMLVSPPNQKLKPSKSRRVNNGN